MNPLKAKLLLPEVASELNLDEQFVKDTSDFFWDHLHKLLANLDDIHIQVNHLGTFHARQRILIKTRDKLRKKLPEKVPTTMPRMASYYILKDQVDKVEKLLWELTKQYKAEKDFRIEKRARKYQAALEEQERDNPGDC